MSAEYVDAVAGWEVFRSRHGEITRHELNEAIKDRGFRPIADRTFGHYRKLHRLGYDEYVSINRLDLTHSSGQVFDMVDRSVYAERDLQAVARLIVPGSSKLEDLAGNVVRVSEGFATFVTQASDGARRIARATRYNRGVLVFERVGVERAVRVHESFEVDSSIHLVLSFRSLLETDLVFPDRTAPSSVGRLSIPLGPDPSAYAVMTAFRRSLDLYESCRTMVDIGFSLDVERSILPSPRVRRLKVSSPLVVEILGSPIVWVVAASVLTRVVPAVVAAASDIQAMIHKPAEEQRRRDRHDSDMERQELEMEGLAISNLKNQIEAAELLDSVPLELLKSAGIDRSAVAGLSNPRRLAYLKDRAVDAVVDVAMEATGEIEYEEDQGDEAVSS